MKLCLKFYAPAFRGSQHHLILKGDAYETIEDKTHNNGNDNAEYNSLENGGRCRGNYCGSQRLAARGAIKRLRTYLASAGRAFNQMRTGSDWRRPGVFIGMLFKRMVTVLATHFSMRWCDIFRIALGTVHRSLVSVSQLSCRRPRSFSAICQFRALLHPMFRSIMVQIGLGCGNENPSEKEIDGGANNEPDKNPFQDAKHRPGYCRRLQRLAARGTTHGLRAHFTRAGGAFDQKRSCRLGGGRRISRWRRVGSGRRGGGGRVKGTFAVLTPHLSGHLDDICGITMGTVHGSLAKVSQLWRAWPRSFSLGAPGKIQGLKARPMTARPIGPGMARTHSQALEGRAKAQRCFGAPFQGLGKSFGPVPGPLAQAGIGRAFSPAEIVMPARPRFDSSFHILPSSFPF
jgi:hypothetical protein